MKKLLSIILVFAFVLILPLSLTSCGEKMGTGACERYIDRDIEGRDIHFVEICVKDYGKMVVLLDATTAPITVANFLKLVEDRFYNGLTFHRVMSNFMIQGGDPKANGTGGSDEEIFGEFLANGHSNDISHRRGVISMARSDAYNSASSQFFICNADSQYSLDGKYAAFGYVVEGLSVVDAITSATASLGDKNGTIADKSEQAKIRYIKVLKNYTLGE